MTACFNLRAKFCIPWWSFPSWSFIQKCVVSFFRTLISIHISVGGQEKFCPKEFGKAAICSSIVLKLFKICTSIFSCKIRCKLYLNFWSGKKNLNHRKCFSRVYFISFFRGCHLLELRGLSVPREKMQERARVPALASESFLVSVFCFSVGVTCFVLPPAAKFSIGWDWGVYVAFRFSLEPQLKWIRPSNRIKKRKLRVP